MAQTFTKAKVLSSLRIDEDHAVDESGSILAICDPILASCPTMPSHWWNNYLSKYSYKAAFLSK